MSLICAAVFCSIGVDILASKLALVVQFFLWNLHTPFSKPAIVAAELLKVAGLIYAVRLMLPLPLDSVAVPLICLADLLRGFLGYLSYCRGHDPDNLEDVAAKVLCRTALFGSWLMALFTSAYFLCSRV